MHPLYVGLHWLAINLGNIFKRCVEWWHLDDGRHEKIIVLKKHPKPLDDHGLLLQGALDVRFGKGKASLNIPNDGLLIIALVASNAFAVATGKRARS